jgi:hypothetical protein
LENKETSLSLINFQQFSHFKFNQLYYISCGNKEKKTSNITEIAPGQLVEIPPDRLKS